MNRLILPNSVGGSAVVRDYLLEKPTASAFFRGSPLRLESYRERLKAVQARFGPAERAQAALARVFTLALSLGGTLSGEHGIGLLKRGFMPQAIDAATLALMRQLKSVFDPDGILNPGKLLP